MATQYLYFYTDAVWTFTGSAVAGIGNLPTASITCIGAGAKGSADGTGGSGGVYARKILQLTSGSKYTIVVGTGLTGDGGASSFSTSGSALSLVKAAGGKSDGTVSHQLAASSGSTVYVGGAGGENYTGYGNYNGGGGGGAAGPLGAGFAGQSGHLALRDTPASGGMMNANKPTPTYGGNGAFYKAGAAWNGIVPASAGEYPGGAGGGGYDYPAGGNSAGTGGNGYVEVMLSSLL
jgi:hypothetical protein